jgi:hypothetical protein
MFGEEDFSVTASLISGTAALCVNTAVDFRCCVCDDINNTTT